MSLFTVFKSAPVAFPTRSLSGLQGPFSDIAGLSQHPQPSVAALLAGLPGGGSGERSAVGQFGPQALFGEVARFSVSDHTMQLHRR